MMNCTLKIIGSEAIAEQAKKVSELLRQVQKEIDILNSLKLEIEHGDK